MRYTGLGGEPKLTSLIERDALDWRVGIGLSEAHVGLVNLFLRPSQAVMFSVAQIDWATKTNR